MACSGSAEGGLRETVRVLEESVDGALVQEEGVLVDAAPPDDYADGALVAAYAAAGLLTGQQLAADRDLYVTPLELEAPRVGNKLQPQAVWVVLVRAALFGRDSLPRARGLHP